MQTSQRKAVPMVCTTNQGMVQTLQWSGPGQSYLPQHQSIPPPPPITIFDTTPGSREQSGTLQTNIRSILRNEMQSLIKEELGTMIQGALKSTFATIKSELQSDVEPSSSPRTVYIQDKSPSRNRQAISSSSRKEKPRGTAHKNESTTDRVIKDDQGCKPKSRSSKSKTCNNEKDTKGSPTSSRKRTRSDSRRDNRRIKTDSRKADNHLTPTTSEQQTKPTSPKWKSERPEKWIDWKKSDWKKADWKKNDWKTTVATSSNAIPVAHGDMEKRLKSSISAFKGDIGNIAETIQAWCQKYAPTTQQPSIEMTAYVEWILRNSHIPNVEEFTMESFTTDEHTPGKTPEEPDQTYYCITPNYLKYSTDQPEAEMPSKSVRLVQWVHCTTPEGLINILKHRAVKPANSHEEEEYGCFFAKGCELQTSQEYFSQDWVRVLHTTWNMAKNQAQLVMCGRAWGTLDKIPGGAKASCQEAHRRGGDTVKNLNDKTLVISTTHHRVRGLAWRHDAAPPHSIKS